MMSVLAACLSGALCVGTVAHSASGASRTPLRSDLVRNGGAEAGRAGYPESVVGNVPSWSRSGTLTVVRYGRQGFLSRSESRRIGGGRKHFSCGFLANVCRASQGIRIRGRGRAIDAGSIRAALRVHVAAPERGGDRGRIVLSFLDADRDTIAVATSRWVAGGTRRYVSKGVSRVLPRRTRRVQVILIGQRREGLYGNVYFDNVRLTLGKAR